MSIYLFILLYECSFTRYLYVIYACIVKQHAIHASS